MDKDMINNLLDKFKKINKEKVNNEKKTLSKFNIFDICKITYDEVNMCRFLFELLNPKGRHLQGEKYLKVFFEKVLNYSPMPSDSELKKAKVLREELTKDKRRIDISINLEINKEIHYIPIEVKIYAEDQELQCFDYYRHALAKNDNDKTRTKVWYLTINGNYPSKYSIEGLNCELDDNDQVVNCDEVQCISFRDILDYINGLINDISQENTEISEKQVLLQFKYALENIIGGQIMANDKLIDLSRIINDKESFIAAESIKDIFPCVVQDKLKLFLDKIYNSLKERDWKLDEERIKKYMMPNCTYPGIFKKFEYRGIKFLLVIELGSVGLLYFGIWIQKADQNEDNKKVLERFVNEFDLNLEERMENYWITWQYLPNQSARDETPNFRKFNDAFYLLFEEDDSSIAENVKNIVDIVNDYEEKLSNSLKVAIDKKHI